MRRLVGAPEQAGLDLDAAGRHCGRLVCRRRVSSVRYAMTRASEAARGDPTAARDALTRVLALYGSQNCCRATRSLALAERHARTWRSRHRRADAASARELAPLPEADSFSRFTGSAWYATALVLEARGKLHEARDAFATAAVQFAGALGDTHADTVRARAGIARLSVADKKGQ